MEDRWGRAMSSNLIRFHLADASLRSGEPYWVASELTEFILCSLFRSIAKQDIGGCKASTLVVGGIAVIWGHGDVEFCVASWSSLTGVCPNERYNPQ